MLSCTTREASRNPSLAPGILVGQEMHQPSEMIGADCSCA